MIIIITVHEFYILIHAVTATTLQYRTYNKDSTKLKKNKARKTITIIVEAEDHRTGSATSDSATCKKNLQIDNV